ncbi:MAG: redoxin domain-containing protein [Chitinophagaceae bacterium]|nr:redoxin domain-containing protein [Chitinophagaceae bacterium]
MRKGVVYVFLVIIFIAIFMLFWYNEYVYSLPTPVPTNYTAVPHGTRIDLSSTLKSGDNKPVLLHFFNPECPCSKFNMPHFKSLVKEFGHKVNFAIVVMGDRRFSSKEVKDKFSIDVPVLTDTSLATLCGVYSTPQAVIIDALQKLYYRGNYNKTRYCTDKKTNYAQMALEALLSKERIIPFDQYSLKAFGCELPHCTKKENLP